jgi:hypothetical protein
VKQEQMAQLTVYQLECRIQDQKRMIAEKERELHALRQALKTRRRNDSRAAHDAASTGNDQTGLDPASV